MKENYQGSAALIIISTAMKTGISGAQGLWTPTQMIHSPIMAASPQSAEPFYFSWRDRLQMIFRKMSKIVTALYQFIIELYETTGWVLISSF